MGDAYTPGLTVASRTVVRRIRRLPMAGEVCVRVGEAVVADTVVARTELPGKAHAVNAAHQLSILPEEVPGTMLKRAGDAVARDEVIARTKGLFGLFKSEVRSPIEGAVETVSGVSGQVLLREPPQPVTVRAYLAGIVVEEIPLEGVVVEAEGAFVQGIFGLGGERHAPLRLLARTPDQRIDAPDVPNDARGRILIGGGLLTAAAFRRCCAVGVAGIIAGGFAYQDIHSLLGRDIGVAVTGQEELVTTLILTEGFGPIAMARASYELLASHDGDAASINGATQIRAGVIRPEVVVPHRREFAASVPGGRGLEVGAQVRCIRSPHFGRIAEVAALPVEARVLQSEAFVRVVEVRFPDGVAALVPRANVEVIERS